MTAQKFLILLLGVSYSLICSSQEEANFEFENEGNPIVKYKFTSDPAPLVDGDKLYIFTGHDESDSSKRPQEWLVFSTSDMVNWVEHAVPLKRSDFAWTLPEDEAWAAHVVKKGNKYYMYATIGSVRHGRRSIGVAVADHPEGPYRDAIGKPMITSNMDNIAIDPSVFIDDDQQAYIFWGLNKCYFAKLKSNMIALDGEVNRASLEGYMFSSWVHKHSDWYYLSYSMGIPAVTGYARSQSIFGPWQFQNIINGFADNSATNHHAIVEFNGKSYLLYHSGALPGGREGKRSICIDELTYGEDGKINKIEQTPKKKISNSSFGKEI